MKSSDLMLKAKEVKEFAYTPYYNFRVGAALLTKSGNVYTGCNIETGAGFSICAERVAAAKAISAGDMEFLEIAVSGDGEEYVFPCGVCRQFLMEFAPDLNVVVSDNKNIKNFTLKELLPNSFKL